MRLTRNEKILAASGLRRLGGLKFEVPGVLCAAADARAAPA